MDVVQLSQFKRHLRAIGFKMLREDPLDDQPGSILWFKQCYKGCPSISLWLDPDDLYDSQVLSLLLDDAESRDCGHGVPLAAAGDRLDPA